MLGVLAFPRESLKRDVGTRPDKSSRHGRVKAVSKCQNICKRAHAHHLHNVLAHLACSSRGFLQPRVQKPRFQRERKEKGNNAVAVCAWKQESGVSPFRLHSRVSLTVTQSAALGRRGGTEVRFSAVQTGLEAVRRRCVQLKD